MSPPNYARDDHDRYAPKTPAFDARAAQMLEARTNLSLRREDFLHFPWEDLDGIVKGIAPGKLWLLAGYSGIAGKTTFLTSLTLDWVASGVTVYYVPLETPPFEIWQRLACMKLGYSPGHLRSGVLQSLPDWPRIESRIDAQIVLWSNDPGFGLYVHPADRADGDIVQESAREAGMLNADVFILDHMDHLRGDHARGDYGMSVDVTRSLDQVRKDDPSLRLLIATQLNNDSVKGDPLAKILPPLESHIKMGSHKREIADGQLGLYRPMRRGVTRDELKAVRMREKDPMLLVEPGQMGVEVMKHRDLGDMLGRQCVLGVSETGRVCHLPERDRYKTGYEDLAEWSRKKR